MRIKAKDMTPEQITHTYCNWCDYRFVGSGDVNWQCSLEEKNLDEKKKEDLCMYKQALRKEEAAEEALAEAAAAEDAGEKSA